MTHFNVLVIGPADRLAAQLAPFDEGLEVEPYFRSLDDWSLSGMRDSYGIAADASPEAYLPHVQDWAGYPGEIVDGAVGYRTTYNPNAKWDYWQTVPIPLRSGRNRAASTVRKGDVDLTRFQVEGSAVPPVIPVYAVLADGVWREPGRVGWFGSSSATEDDVAAHTNWYVQFFTSLGDDTLLTVVDCHI